MLACVKNNPTLSTLEFPLIDCISVASPVVSVPLTHRKKPEGTDIVVLFL